MKKSESILLLQRKSKRESLSRNISNKNLPDILYDIEENFETVENQKHSVINNSTTVISKSDREETWNLADTGDNIVDFFVTNDSNTSGELTSSQEMFSSITDDGHGTFSDDNASMDKPELFLRSNIKMFKEPCDNNANVLDGCENAPKVSNEAKCTNVSDNLFHPGDENSMNNKYRDENQNISVSEESTKTDGALSSSLTSSEHLKPTSMDTEMINKLWEIKTKWKNLCENLATLNKHDSLEGIDDLFQSIGLSLETPKIKTKNDEKEEKITQEVFCHENTQRGENQKTFSQVYLKYKKNKNMITGIQVPLHRVMATIFDPKKLQVESMNKWLDVDNNSKRFTCGMEGVMSVVHAFSMKNELFAFNNNSKSNQPHQGPYDGLADIIWQAGDGRSAIVVQYEPQFSHTRIFECLDARICFNINEVRRQLASVYDTNPQPPISLVLSVVLTRGLDKVQTDLSHSKQKTLLTPDGDETWSLLLLLLIGQAVGHIMHTQFPKNWNPIRSPVGILSLDEYGEKVYVSSHCE